MGERFAVLEETVEVLDELLVGGEAGHATTVRPSRSGRPCSAAVARSARHPLWVGGKGGPRLLRLAARLADGWNMVWRIAPEAYARKRTRDVGRRARTEGRDPATFGLSIGLYSLIGEDEATARAAFERGRAAAARGMRWTATTYESWRADTLSGTPEQVLERDRRVRVVSACEEIIVAPWVLPFAIHEPEQVDLFAERVIAPSRAGR